MSIYEEMINFIFVITLIFCVNAQSNEGNGSFLFTVSGVLRAGCRESACLSLHGPRSSLRTEVTITVESTETKKVAITKKSFEAENVGCFDLRVPDTTDSTANIHLQIKFFNESQQIQNINSIDYVKIVQNSGISIIQTDKEIYKPGDRVKIRILLLSYDLTVPKNLMIPIVKILNPNNIAIGQWENVTTELGLVQLEHQLSSETLLGYWRIELPGNNNVFKIFQVKDYVLPRFEVIINHPKIIYVDANNFSCTVCAHYVYGQPIKGTSHLKVHLLAQDLKVNQIQQLQNGCAQFTFNRSDIPIVQRYEHQFVPLKLHINARVTEQGTGQISSADSEIELSNDKYRLEFVNLPPHFQIGLPYQGELHVLDSFEDVKNKNVRICYNYAIDNTWNLTKEQCGYFKLNDNNLTSFTIFPFRKDITVINLKANLEEKNNSVSIQRQNVVYHDVKRWYSFSNSFIQISYDRLSGPVKCKSWQTFTILYTLNITQNNSNSTKYEPITFNYLVKSKGNIIKFGKVIHTPCSQPFDINDYQNVIGNVTDLQLNLPVDKFILTVKILQKMHSNAELLVYYVRNDGEVIANKVSLIVENCLANKIEAGWSVSQSDPGEIVGLKVKAAVGSLCTFSAIDKRTTLLGSPVHLTYEMLLKSAQKPSFSHASQEKCILDYEALNGEDSLPYWDLRRKRSYNYYPSNTYDTLQMFSNTQLLVMTDLKIISRPCSIQINEFSTRFIESASYETQSTHKGTDVRFHFPETWLWELVPIGRSGEMNLKVNVPHSITEWVGHTVCMSSSAGVGLSSFSALRVFKPFFVDVIAPYSIKRNEVTHLKIIAHNYLNHSLPVAISLGVNENMQVAGAPDEMLITKCIHSKDTTTETFRVTALTSGNINFTITAEVDSVYPGECGPEVLLNRKDTIIKSILVDLEGFPFERTLSNFVCVNDSLNGTRSKEQDLKWNIEIPYDAIKNSSRLKILLDADLLELTIENLGSLLNIPTGCGEQIMATLAPNLYVLHYLNLTQNLSFQIEKKIKNFIRIGYERIQKYRHKDGSFSAFGENNYDIGSMFLTAFILRTLSQASNFVYIDDEVINRAAIWIIEKQFENGCFPATSHAFHSRLSNDNGVDNVALTAYVLISLIESGVPLPERVRDNAKYCLRSYNSADKYTMAIVAYALTLVHWHNEAARSIERLLEMSNRKDGLLWWEDTESLPNSIEMTSYMILSFLKSNSSEHIALAHEATRWLLTKRNPNGGFISTQDTVVALDALTKFASVVKKNNTNVTVSITTGGKHLSYRMRNSAKLKTKQISLHKFSSFIKFNVTGVGCLLIQTVLRYNMPQIISSEALKLVVSTESVSTIDKCTITQLSSCLSYTFAKRHLNMAVLDVSLPSGYKADRTSLFALVTNSQTKVQRFEESENRVILYFTEITDEKICVPFLISEESVIENRTEAVVRFYDYYNPNVTTSTNYTLPTCD